MNRSLVGNVEAVRGEAEDAAAMADRVDRRATCPGQMPKPYGSTLPSGSLVGAIICA